MIDIKFGDCLELMDDIPDKSVDLVLVDPPFGTTKCKWDSIIPLPEMWAQLKRIIKDRGAILIMAQTPFDKVLGCSNLEMLRYEWILEKPAATGFFNAKKMPLKAHENILVFYKNLPKYNPQMTHGHVRKTSGRDDVNSECYGKAVKKTFYDSTDRYPRSIQKFSSDKQKLKLHPVQKPLKFMEYLIETYTDKGDLVVDFAMGSGTTGEGCINLERDFIGFENDLEIFKTAEKRLLNRVK